MSASASMSASATPSATATAFAPRGHHHHGGGASSASSARSASATVDGKLPGTGGVPWVSLVSVGVLALLVGSGLLAYRLRRRST
jgi:LPXTG-motif cell wall-anchored protein